MPDWTDTGLPADNIITRVFWTDIMTNDPLALNDIIGHPNGGHVSLTDGGVLLGNGQGAIQAMSGLSKGSLLVGDDVSGPVELTVGANDTLLRGEASEASGAKWELPNWDVAEALIYG